MADRHEVQIGLPRWMKIYTLVFGVVWLGTVSVGLIAGLVADNAPAGIAVISALMLVLGGTFLLRLFRLGATSEGDVLMVRNHLRTTEFRRGDVEDFRVGSGPLPLADAVFVIPKTGRMVGIDASLQIGTFFGDRHPEQIEELETWLHG